MNIIQTVTGAVDAESLGFCHSHEHLFIAEGQSCRVNPALRIDDRDKSLEELLAFRAAGGGAIVDAQPPGCGRDAGALAWLAENSGVRVIASTGFHKLMFYPDGHWITRLDTDALTRVFLSELRQGMFVRCDDEIPAEQCVSRAGLVKAALDSGTMSDTYRRLFTAAASAAKQSGAALMVHIEKGARPDALVKLLVDCGLSLDRVIFCHMDRAEPDLEVHKRLCALGIFMEYDTIGRPKYHSDRHEASLIAQMAEAGYGNNILLGLDTTRERLASYGGQPGLTHLRSAFLPELQKAGVPKETICRFVYENPARAFAIAAG